MSQFSARLPAKHSIYTTNAILGNSKRKSRYSILVSLVRCFPADLLLETHGGALYPSPDGLHVTHILLVLHKEYRDLVYDLPDHDTSNRPSSNAWTGKELVSAFGRKDWEDDEIRPGRSKVVLQAAWVKDCLETGKYLNDRNWNGWEIR